MEYKKLYEDILQEHRRVYESLDEKDLYRFIDTVKKHDRIFLIGVGREGMATRAFAMRLMHMGKEIHWIWDDTTPSINKGDLLIATLGDGEIGHIRYICQKAKENGGEVIWGPVTDASNVSFARLKDNTGHQFGVFSAPGIGEY